MNNRSRLIMRGVICGTMMAGLSAIARGFGLEGWHYLVAFAVIAVGTGALNAFLYEVDLRGSTALQDEYRKFKDRDRKSWEDWT